MGDRIPDVNSSRHIPQQPPSEMTEQPVNQAEAIHTFKTLIHNLVSLSIEAKLKGKTQ